MYMIEKAKNLAQEKGVHSESEVYIGHPIDNRTEKIVIEYYINDDFNFSRQSPNKSDVITVKINDKKEKKVKRFLTRSLKATYEIFKNDYPELKISKSKFYSLRPKYVLLTRRVHTLRETDFRGHWRVDFWYVKRKPSVPNSIS